MYLQAPKAAQKKDHTIWSHVGRPDLRNVKALNIKKEFKDYRSVDSLRN